MKQNLLIKIHIILNVKMSSKQKTLLLGWKKQRLETKELSFFYLLLKEAQV